VRACVYFRPCVCLCVRSDIGNYCKSLWIKEAAKCPKCDVMVLVCVRVCAFEENHSFTLCVYFLPLQKPGRYSVRSER
jgi:hypothetical protein